MSYRPHFYNSQIQYILSYRASFLLCWGSKVLERVAKDLQNKFPGVEGFSRRNMFTMRAFYHAYGKVQQAVAQLENLPIFSILRN